MRRLQKKPPELQRMTQKVKKSIKTTQNLREHLRTSQNSKKTSEYHSEPSGTFHTCLESVRMPQIMSETLRHPQNVRELLWFFSNLSKLLRTNEIALTSLRGSRMPQNHQEFYKKLKLMRTPENTPKYRLNIKDASESSATFIKSYRAQKALEPSGIFQNFIRTNINVWDNIKRLQNVRQPLRTFTNVSKAHKTHKIPQNIPRTS